LKQLTGNTGNQIRDIHFVYAYIVYQLLSRRIQRDLLLMSTLFATSGADGSKRNTSKHPDQKTKAEFDYRFYPAIVKLLDTVIQSLAQMRTLNIVDDNPELASAIDARLSITKGRRCSYLACCYSAVKKYAEALALLQHAAIHIRETVSSLSPSNSDLINDGNPGFFPLSKDDVKELEDSITEDSFQYKRDWFAFNGGSPDADPSSYTKPLFFNIALNYIDLDMDRLRNRAGKGRASIPAPASSLAQEQGEKKLSTKAKIEELSPETAPAPSQPTRGGLSSLLGGWWK
jgi:signal recognition particle subunit SRP68